jgi:hypothetical protein
VRVLAAFHGRCPILLEPPNGLCAVGGLRRGGYAPPLDLVGHETQRLRRDLVVVFLPSRREVIGSLQREATPNIANSAHTPGGNPHSSLALMLASRSASSGRVPANTLSINSTINR